jgi:hypothetical protein
MMPEIGFYQPGMGWSYEQLRDFWVEGENLGFDYGWMMDNVTYRHLYKLGQKVPVFETWTVLPALAEATSKIRMGPMVSPVNRRHPALFAKITSCFDQISNGRLELGMGAGDTAEYHLPWGMPFPKASVRVETLREEIQVLKLMWAEKNANFNGKYYTLIDATMDPKPIQKPHPPIWMGILRGKMMTKLAAEEADGVNVYNASHRAAVRILGEIITPSANPSFSTLFFSRTKMTSPTWRCQKGYPLASHVSPERSTSFPNISTSAWMIKPPWLRKRLTRQSEALNMKTCIPDWRIVLLSERRIRSLRK